MCAQAGDLGRLMPGVSEKMLIRKLRRLTAAGLLHKQSYGKVPPRVGYTLTERGRDVLPLIAQFTALGSRLVEAA